MTKRISTLLFLVAIYLLAEGTCLQLQHDLSIVNDILVDGKCKYGYLISLNGEVWDKAPPNAPDAGRFATNQVVSFDGIYYGLSMDRNGQRMYTPIDPSSKGVILIKMNDVYVAGVWDYDIFGCWDKVEKVAN